MRITIESRGLLHAPSFLRWAIAAYAQPDHKKPLKEMLSRHYRIPEEVAENLLEGRMSYEILGDTVVIHAAEPTSASL